MSFVSSVHSTKPSLQITRRGRDFHPTNLGNNLLKYAHEPQEREKEKAKRVLKSTKSFVSAIHSKKNTHQITRRTGDFEPTIWGDYFLRYAYESQGDDNKAEQKLLESKKEQVRRMLCDTKSSDQMLIQLIDTIQRLGIAYHFESEISKILGQIHKLVSDVGFLQDDLYTISLIFRLLRQEGFNTSSDIFKQFIDKEGKFKDELHKDVQGMLSLYEAAHFLKRGEAVLNEALSFTTVHLQSSITSSDDMSLFLVMQIKNALKHSIRKGMSRMEAKHFILIYHEDPSCNELLLSFAKLDFNNVQKLHRKEIGDASKWWIKDLDFSSKIPYARDRLVECYMFSLGSHFEPKLSLARIMLTKVLCIVSVIDDTYDTHGTLEELQAFTDAVHKWDIKCINQLPEYMKPIYQALLDVYEETEKAMVTEGRGSYCMYYTKEIAKRHIQSYFDQAKWFFMNHVPTVEEYMEVGLVTCSCDLMPVFFFLEMGDIANEEAFKWLWEYPEIVRIVAIIGRIMDDIVSHKLERERGHSASCIECYMKQYDATEEEAYNYFRVQIEEGWKDLNEVWLERRDMPKPLLLPSINLLGFVDALWKDESCYTKPGGIMKDTIKSLFVDPLPV